MNRFHVLALGLTAGGLCLGTAPSSHAQESQTNQPVRLPDLTIAESHPSLPQVTVDPDRIHSPTAGNVGETLIRLPGLSAVRRGGCAAEPVIRGLGWERVATVVDGLPLHGACPARMDPPLSYVGQGEPTEMRVAKGLPSVTLGPGGTGGRVELDTLPRRPADGMDFTTHAVDALWNGARKGGLAHWTTEHTRGALDTRLTLEWLDYGDYEGADGTTVPANHESQGASLGVGWQVDPRQRLSLGYALKRERDVDYPSLPMNSEYADHDRLVGSWRWAEPDEPDALELRLGYTRIDHLMSNRGKPNRRMMEAETPSEAEGLAGRAAAWRSLGPDAVVAFGVDGSRLQRDATRTRRMVTTGRAARDHIWPDVTADQLGTYGEWSGPLTDGLRLRAGARVDVTDAEARAGDDPVMLGPNAPRRSIRDWYAAYYGEAARSAGADHEMVSANLVLEHEAGSSWTVYGGIGRVSRAPAVTEQFFAFAPAPGGYQVGNPALDPEVRHSVELGARHDGGRVEFTADVFVSEVTDYIAPYALDRRDVNGDGTVNLVRGFRNLDAELYGGEIGALWKPTQAWTLPLEVSMVRAQESGGGDLPEIPPVNGRTGLRYATADTWWVEGLLQFAARQDRIDPGFPEDETPGWAIVDLRAGLQLDGGWTIEAGIVNLLDKNYHEHLTREALLPVGDLAAGDEVPSPGRHAYVSVGRTW